MASPSPIRLIRDAAFMSMQEMGDALELTRQRVHQLESGGAIPAWVAIRLTSKFPAECEALGLTLEAIVRHRRTTTGRTVKPRRAAGGVE